MFYVNFPNLHILIWCQAGPKVFSKLINVMNSYSRETQNAFCGFVLYFSIINYTGRKMMQPGRMSWLITSCLLLQQERFYRIIRLCISIWNKIKIATLGNWTELLQHENSKERNWVESECSKSCRLKCLFDNKFDHS